MVDAGVELLFEAAFLSCFLLLSDLVDLLVFIEILILFCGPSFKKEKRIFQHQILGYLVI